jgi:hypothetical protein
MKHGVLNGDANIHIEQRGEGPGVLRIRGPRGCLVYPIHIESDAHVFDML